MITGIPNYTDKHAIEYSLRCTCSKRYLILTGFNLIGDAEGRAKERAEQLNATFIDLRQTPFLNCECGELIDFTVQDGAVPLLM